MTLTDPQPGPRSPSARPNPRSIALIVLAWLVLHIGCLFSPGLLDDVDSIYIEIAREMLHRRDFITPYIDGVRFFDKPPLMYWLAAASMRVFGETDWAARLPLALSTLVLLLATYALALYLFRGLTPAHPDRPALYAALALATSIGPFLYTRFFIPDILICLWLTLAIHAFLLALDRIQSPTSAHNLQPATRNSPLLPCLAFVAVTALNLLTKGLIGVLFPLAFVLLYLAWTRQLRLIPKFHLIPSTAVFLAIAAPWHILAALRNPPIPLPPGLDLPARGGWAWFYLYNEHVARFLQRRIPHDYGQVPVWLFWLLAALWLFPWTAFLPPAFLPAAIFGTPSFNPRVRRVEQPEERGGVVALEPAPITSAVRIERTAYIVPMLWAGIILLFFTFSARQEYYSLPALPAFALLAGALLARASNPQTDPAAARATLAWHRNLLLPLGSLASAIALFFAVTAPHPHPGADLATLLAQGGDYNLSLSHLFDLTAPAMGLFRAPLVLFGLAMAAIGPGTYLLRRRHPHAANLTLAAAAAGLLLAMHSGLVRFYPTLGSKSLAQAILTEQSTHPPTCNPQPAPCNSSDLILIDGELTAGSTLVFYTRQPVHLVNGRVNGPWYGSFWPDAPAIFDDDTSLHQLWSSPRRLFLLTYHPEARTADLSPFGSVHTLAASGGKSILINR